MELIQELITEVANDFKEHLLSDVNSRILFSGKFGKGKTTFLETFFSNQAKYIGLEEFRYIYLDPVHYSVAGNEDIFRYIKYDVLLSLMKLDIDFNDITFNKMEAASFYLWKHPEEAIRPLIEFVPKVGKAIDAMLPKFEALYNKIASFQKEVNAQPEAAKIISFIDRIEADPRSLYESDTITHIIQDILKREKEKDKKEM